MFQWWFGVLDFNTVYSVTLTTSRHMAWLNPYLIIKFKSYSSRHSGKKSFTSIPKTAWWKICILVIIYLLMATIGWVKRFVKCDLCDTFYISSPLNSQVTIWKSLMKDTDKIFFFFWLLSTHIYLAKLNIADPIYYWNSVAGSESCLPHLFGTDQQSKP